MNCIANKNKFLFSLVEIDFAMGTKVFGYRDLRTGKFVARSNYSFQIDAFCDGKRYVKDKSSEAVVNKIIFFRFNYPSWQVTVSDRKNLIQGLLPDNLDRLKDINNYISGVLKRPVYADLPDKQFIAYFRKQLKEHIHTRDITKVIVSYTGN